jgi:hypothetical protein
LKLVDVQGDAGNRLLVLESGGFTYLSVSKSVDEKKLCFEDHRMEAWDSVSDMCCLRGAGHVHAHVHHGDSTEDILLEQVITLVDQIRFLVWRVCDHT